MKIGVRNIKWNSRELLLNDEPIYLRGFGKHEDSIVSYEDIKILYNKNSYNYKTDQLLKLK